MSVFSKIRVGDSSWTNIRRVEVVRVLIGALLIVASGMKLQALVQGDEAGPSIIDSRPVVFVAIQLEFLLGVCLVLRVQPKICTMASMGFFGIAALVSFNKAMSGESSCGCFGKIAVSPWYTFGLDLACLMLLGAMLMRLRKEPIGSPNAAKWSSSTISGMVLLLFASAYSIGSSQARRIEATPREVNVGEVKSGDHVDARITLRNNKGERVNILGGTSDCSCTATKDLPQTIEAGGSTNILVHLRARGTSGKFSRKVEFYTDDKEEQTATVWLSGLIK